MNDDRASSRRASRSAVTVLVLGLACPLAANAQFSTTVPAYMNLPSNDFTWTWGVQREADLAQRPDMTVDGSDQGFLCKLRAGFSPSIDLSYQQIQDYEQYLRTSGFFVSTVANEMQVLTNNLRVRWARLDCMHPEKADQTPQEQAEREAKLREKADKKRERRRARDGVDDDFGF
jgi:hypothetical protein